MRNPLATPALFLAAACTPVFAQFNYQLYGMPDFDQKRPVPCNGAGHCAPTAAIDLMAYISNHGYPAIMDGPRNWQLEEHADDVTFDINLMGIYMDTDAQCAGTAGGWGDGLINYMNLEAEGLFTVTERHATADDNNVTPFWMYVKLFGGGLVNFCYGRYAQLPNQTWERQPGHVVTLNGLFNADTNNVTFNYRNPGTDDDITFQSIFATTSLNATASTISTGGLNLNMWELHTTSTDGRRRYIDGWLGVDTTFVLTPTTPGILLQHKPFRLTIDQTPPTSSTTLPGPSIIRNAVLHPDLSRAFITTATTGSGLPQLWRYTRYNHAFTPLLTLTNADAPMCTSRQGDLYIMLGSQLRRYNAAGVPQQLNAFTPSAPVTALAYDDTTDRVVALLSSTRTLVFLPRTIDSAVEKVLPSTIPLGGNETITIGAGRTEFEGRYFITSVQHIYRVGTEASTSRLILEEDISITGLTPVFAQSMDSGHLLVSNGSTLSELRRISTGWAVHPGSVFNGLACGARFDVSRSRSNLDRAFHTSPNWDNTIDPLSIAERPDPVCTADFNGDGDFGTDADIEAFFACLAGTCCPTCLTADFNGDGDTGTDADIESFFRVLSGGNC